MPSACSALGTDLQANDLIFWIKVDEQTLVTQHLIEEDTAAFRR
jgi:hypothetical protein